MKTENYIYNELGFLGGFFRWMDSHPRTATAILWLQVAILLYVILTYDFTTRI